VYSANSLRLDFGGSCVSGQKASVEYFNMERHSPRNYPNN
jgi:hypothetical protein